MSIVLLNPFLITSQFGREAILILQNQLSVDGTMVVFGLFGQFMGDPLLKLAHLVDVPQMVENSLGINGESYCKFSDCLARV